MYHALVFDPATESVISMGLHVPGPAWTDAMHDLQANHGGENVGYTFNLMEEAVSYTFIEQRVLDEIERAPVAFRLLRRRDASVLSKEWESGVMPFAAVIVRLERNKRGDYAMPVPLTS